MTRLAPPALLQRLEERGIPFALIGAVALARHGATRYSTDVDLLTLRKEVLVPEFWTGLADAPELRKGDFEDPLEGVARWGGPRPVDLIVGRGAAMAFAVQTAVADRQLGIPVATPLGLLLLKLEAGSAQDRYDILSLVSAQRALNGAAWLAELPARESLLSESARIVLEELRPELLKASV